MNGKTHLMGGLAACAVVETVVDGSDLSPLFYLSGMVGAFLPDICHVHSTIGRRLPLLSRIVSFLFGHRTFTHSILFLAVVYGLLHVFLPDARNVQLGLFAGMISHIILDMATVRGVKLFFPFSLRVRLPLFIRTGGKFEGIVQFALVIWLVIWSYQFVQTWM
ncbi:metal-dependent hydrolase [Alkalicoccobacillus plakortidis]|uniref:Metal-dependent hydrolase n=1 Tax=Alkalicoccobacillus plakortidis TaxID=444060 RepID=A0ABT0XER9_9BACI|nr:metal-dependent hydrolase [Alkalicoccobacillus plakortidis]MCM2674230.1 metal-dependent hydrolase [Alkalicoccobacillus plakortidis]